MLKLIKKIIDFLSTPFEIPTSEPEFLGEYWVYYGTKSYTTVYAKSSEDAKCVAMSTKPHDVPSDKVYAVYKRLSARRNPDYQVTSRYPQNSR